MEERLAWRAAQAWLAGYSDGLVNERTSAQYWDGLYSGDYNSGFDHGAASRVAVSA